MLDRILLGCLGLTGFACLLFVHILLLGDLPGLHFDEAWVGNLAYRLISQPELVEQQSPYATPWGARLLSTIYKFTPWQGIVALRGLQIAFVFFGFFFTALALWRWQRTKVLALWPWVLLALPALTINHRFAIELTGLHVACFGLLVYGVALVQTDSQAARGRAMILIAALIGMSAHILFLAPLLALFLVAWKTQDDWRVADRRLVQALAISFLPFSIHIFFAVPERGKAAALVVLAIAILFVIADPISSKRKLEQLLDKLPNRFRIFMKKYFVLAIAAPFLFNALFFSDGHWGVMLTHGFLTFNGFIGVTSILLLAILFKASRESALSREEKQFRDWFLITLIFLGLMMLKPAPRYFEIAFLQISLVFSWALARLELPRAIVGGLAAGMVGLSTLTINYFSPQAEGLTRETEFRLLWFRDSSRDFLNKQKLVAWLNQNYCTREEVSAPGDTRVELALNFLAQKDWPTLELAPPCTGAPLEIWRRQNSTRPDYPNDPLVGVADFAIVSGAIRRETERE